MAVYKNRPDSFVRKPSFLQRVIQYFHENDMISKRVYKNGSRFFKFLCKLKYLRFKYIPQLIFF